MYAPQLINGLFIEIKGCSFDSVLMDMDITRKPRRGRKPGKETNCLELEPSSSATASSLSAPATSSSASAISSSAPSAKTTRQKRTPKLI